jgi:hypothetical protein
MPHTVGQIYRAGGAAPNSGDASAASIQLNTTTGNLSVDNAGTAATFYPAENGATITKNVLFTENATATTHTGSVVLPAGAVLIDILVTSEALWTGGAAVMKVGDSVDDDGYFIGVDLKATDLLVGEVVSVSGTTGNWGGKNGAYLVAATGRRGPAATNFGHYQKAGTTITGVVTVTTPATTVGRTVMTVVYAIPTITAATAA